MAEILLGNNENLPDSLDFVGGSLAGGSLASGNNSGGGGGVSDGSGAVGERSSATNPSDMQALNNHNFFMALSGVARGSHPNPHFAMPVS